MKYQCFFLLFFTFGSMSSQTLEDAVYSATETFNNSKSETALRTLNIQIEKFKPQLSTIDEHFAFLSLLINKAYYLDQNNVQQKAISTYEAALKRYKNQKIDETYKYDIVEYCLIPLGNLYTKSGDFTNAENTIKQYIFLAEKNKNDKQRVSGCINLAKLYYSIGKFQSAIAIVEKGLKSEGKTVKQKQKLETIKTNCIIASGEANSVLNDKTVLEGSQSQFEIKYKTALKNKDYKTAFKYFNLKSTYLKKETLFARELAKHKVEEAQLYYVSQDFENASSSLKSALLYLLPNHNSNGLPSLSDLYPENTFIDIFDLLARLQPNVQNALNCYDLSFYVSGLMTENLTGNEAKLIHSYNNRQRAETCIDLLFEAYKTNSYSLAANKALVYAEKNKASILNETVNKKSLLAQHPDDDLLLYEQELLSKNERLTNHLIIAQYGKNSEKVNNLSSELSSLSTELKTLKTAITKRYPNTELSVNSLQLQEKLNRDNAILIEYFYGDFAVYQFVVSASSVSFNKIERDEMFNTAVKTYISFFKDASTINNNVSAFTVASHKLYNVLRFDETNISENVVVIPDGLLNFVPFESLLVKPTETNSYANMPFVVNKQRLAYNSSAKIYVNGKSSSKTQKLLGVFPVFKGSNTELMYSINEAESIDKFTNAKVLTHQTATKQAFLDSASNYDILHLSTHADSGAFLEPSHIEFIDETLYLNELYSLNFNPDLVVLSACETGVGKLQKGEGSMNLARGFQYAGAKNILFSLWKINDLSTSQLMHQFYKNYKKSSSAFMANHASKIDYLNDKTIKNSMKSPYYWGPFVFYGTLTKPKIDFNLYYIVIGVLGCIMVLFFIHRLTKKGWRKLFRFISN